MTFKGSAIRVKPRAHVSVWGTIGTKGNIREHEIPALVASQFGSGRVVYFAAGLDAAYYSYSYPYQRIVLKSAIEWASQQAQPVTVTAPMCVHASVMHQTLPHASDRSNAKNAETDRILVHLFNDLNTTAQHALPVDDVPLREETVPIHDIAIEFSGKYRFSRVHLEPEGRNLPLEKLADGKQRIVVPKLDIHSIVVGELIPVEAHIPKTGEPKFQD